MKRARFSNIIVTFESYSLSQADGAKLIRENETDQNRYDHVRELVKAGKAHFDSLLCGCVAVGRPRLWSRRWMSLPMQLALSTAIRRPSTPTDFKRRNVGRRLVLERSNHYGLSK